MIKRFITLCTLLCFCTTSFPAFALIRDAEIEHTLRLYADPIFKAAGVKPSSVHLFIVDDDTLNAYVAGGANMFIHTGLIMACDTPDMLIGVMAHETGHIVGGHLAQGAEQLRHAQLGSILGYVLGAVAAVASRNSGVATGVIAGSQNSVMRNFISFTRAHEEAADQSALNTLDKLQISASGFLKMFELLRRHEREQPGNPDPYMLTHPLTNTRIEHVRNHVETSSVPEGQYPHSLDILHQRMVAKLYGFLETPEHTFLKYPQSNKSVPARMARAIAYYKLPDLDRSIKEMDGLLAEAPKDAFFHELKGQILFENNHPKEALVSYRKADELYPNSALILSELAQVELAQNDPSLVTTAIAHLEKSVGLDNSNPEAWHQLALAYGKQNNTAMSALSLAEEDELIDDPKSALQQINVALANLKDNGPVRQRAQDLRARALDMRREEKEGGGLF